MQLSMTHQIEISVLTGNLYVTTDSIEIGPINEPKLLKNMTVRSVFSLKTYR